MHIDLGEPPNRAADRIVRDYATKLDEQERKELSRAIRDAIERFGESMYCAGYAQKLPD